MRADLEAQLARHVQLEARQQSQLEQEKKFLNSKADFSSWGAFRAIDKEGLGQISIYQLSVFLRQSGYSVLDSDIDCLLYTSPSPRDS